MIYFGLDVSKGYANVGILGQDGHQLKSKFLIDDTSKGHKILEENICWAASKSENGEIKIGMESSGGYESNFLNFCFKLQSNYSIDVYHLNPLSVKKFIEVDLHRSKNDDKDASDIARYILKNDKIEPAVKQRKEIRGLKEIIKMIERDVKESTKLRNVIQMYIQNFFPELLQHCKYGLNVWALKLLSKYPTAEDIRGLDVKILKEIPFLTEIKAQNIIELAKKSISDEADRLTKITIKQVSERILQMNNSIKKMKKEAIKEYKIISPNKASTVYGIGEYTAAAITAFSGNIDNFSDSNKYTAFFGLDPRISDSGDSVMKRKITKKGNHIVRKLLYISILSCIAKEGHPIKRMYDRLRSRGICHFSAATACMRKLLCIVFGILKSGKDFDMNYEDEKKSEEQSKKSLERKEMRIKSYDSYDVEAPISKRERNRRNNIAAMSQKSKDLRTRSIAAECIIQ
jgi:transposase